MGMDTSKAKKSARRWQPLADQFADRPLLNVRIAHVPADSIFEKQPQLHGQGFVQVELVPQVFDLASGDGTPLSHHDVHRVTRGQPHEEENHDGDAEHDGDGDQNAFQNPDSSHRNVLTSTTLKEPTSDDQGTGPCPDP